jgi:hypothetical protein
MTWRNCSTPGCAVLTEVRDGEPTTAQPCALCRQDADGRVHRLYEQSKNLERMRCRDELAWCADERGGWCGVVALALCLAGLSGVVAAVGMLA